MAPKFNIDRPKVTDEELDKHKDFNELVKKFKQQSLQKAREDHSWWKNKKVRYASAIAGVTVVCTITFATFFNNKQTKLNDKITTQNNTSEAGHKTEGMQDPDGKIAFVNAPSSKIAIPYSSYKINNAKGGEIKHFTSSKINIPKNSFVDKNGKDIVGDVTIEYREFHDKGDIIAGGIPMAYDSAGKKFNLESAGMFDVIGHQDGEPVFIKPDKDLKIELASDNSENRFNQYYLDTVERNWKYIKHDEPKPSKSVTSSACLPARQGVETKTPNKKLETLKREIEVIIPKKIDSVKVVYTKKAEVLPKPKEPFKPKKSTGRPTFQIDASPKDFPELAAFENAIFEVGSENTGYTKEMSEITWSDVKITQGPQKGINYLLTLSYRGRVEKLIMYPVLSAGDFDKAQKKYEQKFEVYQGLVEKRTQEETRLKTEMENKQKAYLAEQDNKKAEYEKERSLYFAKMQAKEESSLEKNFNAMANPVKAVRLFEVSKFGIYNSDCALAGPKDGLSISPIFILNTKDKPLFPSVIYLVDHTQNSVYSFLKADFSKMLYNEKNTNSFVIFVKNKMYLCNKISFKESTEGNNNKFTVTELPDNADNLFDFKKALEI